MTWEITETLELVEACHGEAARRLADASLHSAHQRLRFAHYHYNLMDDLLKAFIAGPLRSRSFFDLAWSKDLDERAEYFHFRDKVSANALACVQSIHAMADLLASGVFHSLNLGQMGKPVKAAGINVKSVLERLDVSTDFSTVTRIMRTMLADPAFIHVDALSNQAKHRNVTPTALNEDVTGERAKRFELRFAAFRRDAMDFGEVEFRELLSPAYDAASHGLVDTGKELMRLLKIANV